MGHGGQNASIGDPEVASRISSWCPGDLSPDELDGPRKAFALLYAVPPDILQHRIMACLDGASLNHCALTSQKLQQFSTKQKKMSADEASRSAASAASSDLSECGTECSFGDVNTVHMVLRHPHDGTVMNQQLCGFYSRVRMTMHHNERPGLMRQFLPMPHKIASSRKGHQGKGRQTLFDSLSSTDTDTRKFEEASGPSHLAASTSKQSKRPSKRKARPSSGSASRADCSVSDGNLADLDPRACFSDMDAAMYGTGDMKSTRALAILESMLCMQQESNNAKRQRLLEQCNASQSSFNVHAEAKSKRRDTQVLIQHLKSMPTTDEWHSEQLAESQCYMCLTRPFLRKTRDHDVAHDLLFCIKCNSAVHAECLKLYGREPKDKLHWVCYYCWAARRRSKRIEKLAHYVRACSDSVLDDSEFEKHLQFVKHRCTSDEPEDDESSMISPHGTGSRSGAGASNSLQMVTRHNRYDKWGHCAQHAASIWPLSKPYFECLHPDDYRLLVPKSESDDVVTRLARLDDQCDEQDILL